MKGPGYAFLRMCGIHVHWWLIILSSCWGREQACGGEWVLKSTLDTLDSRCEDCQENRDVQCTLGLWVYVLEGKALGHQALCPSQLGNQSMNSDRLQLEKSLKEEFRGIKDQISGWEDIHVAQLLSQKQRTEVAIAYLTGPTSTSISNRKLKPPETGPHTRFSYCIFPQPLQ